MQLLNISSITLFQFKHTGDEIHHRNRVTTGTHTTPIHEYVDDLTFTFEVEPGEEEVNCSIKVIFLII